MANDIFKLDKNN